MVDSGQWTSHLLDISSPEHVCMCGNGRLEMHKRKVQQSNQFRTALCTLVPKRGRVLNCAAEPQGAQSLTCINTGVEIGEACNPA
jgi:hypothetical protein